MRVFLAALLTLGLAACATSSGERATGFMNAQIASAYMPLDGRTYLLLEGRGAAVVIAPGVAVTNAHNADIVGKAQVIGTSRNYDLLFFRVDRNVSLNTMEPRSGQQVVAYGQGSSGELRVANGIVRTLNAPVEARCQTCQIQAAFTFEGNAGPGFSGGPVVDAASGALVGITFGYLDPQGHRLMYAYPMSRVRNELSILMGQLPQAINW